MDVDYYNSADDTLDIHKSNNLFQDLKEFLSSLKTMEACNFCLGYLGKSQAHHQLESEFISDPRRQKITRRTHLDYCKMVIEGIKYYLRRLNEKITGNHTW